MGALARQLG